MRDGRPILWNLSSSGVLEFETAGQFESGVKETNANVRLRVQTAAGEARKRRSTRLDQSFYGEISPQN